MKAQLALPTGIKKLTNIAAKPTINTRDNQPFRQNPHKTSVSINRRRQEDKIARENEALARRLNSVKPTSNLSSKAAAKHSQEHARRLRVLQGPPRPAYVPMLEALPAGPGRSRASSANPHGRRTPNGAGPILRLGGERPDFAF